MRNSTIVIILLLAVLGFIGYLYYVETRDDVRISVDPPSVEVN